MKTLILAIESSCDDSSVALIDRRDFKCLFHQKISQDSAHAEFGGVVPELAARLHTTALPRLLEQCKGYFSELCAVAVTSEPGLSVSLLGGVTMAKVLSASLRVPLIAVNHLIGHIYSLFLSSRARTNMGVLLVSGGHTMLVNVDGAGFLKVLASTNDDAFGESFDKVAKMLGLGYPGGAAVQNLAQIATQKSLKFPVPLRKNKDLNFSFSGLKNAVRVEISRLLDENLNKNLQILGQNLEKNSTFAQNSNEILGENSNLTQNSIKNSSESLNLSKNSTKNLSENEKNLKSVNLSESQKSEIAYAFENAAVAHLIDKCKIAFERHKFKAFGVVGGASANLKLRNELEKLCAAWECEFMVAELEFCADNALMIARAACEMYERGEFVGLDENIISPKNKYFFRL